MEIKRYRVLIGYVSYTGEVIQPGEYTNLQIDLAEARNKSMVVDVDSNVKLDIDSGLHQNTIRDIKLTSSSYKDVDAIGEIKLEPVIQHIQVNTVKINSASLEELTALKFVAEKTASLVIKEREKSHFTNYIDLNKRVPLRGRRKWEDIAVIDFSSNPKLNILLEGHP